MVIIYGVIGFVGGLITAATLWQCGVLVALVAAPFGASLLVAVSSVIFGSQDRGSKSAIVPSDKAAILHRAPERDVGEK